jgi:hypothetical protein
MNGKTEKLKGRGRLVWLGTDMGTSYELLVVTEAVPAGHFGNPTAEIDGLKTITGRAELSNSKHPPFGEKVTLILEDGRKLFVLMQSDGSLKATGSFFK